MHIMHLTVVAGSWGATSLRVMKRVVTSGICAEKMAMMARPVAASSTKMVWVWTKNKDVMTAAVEGGWNTFIFTPQTEELAISWKGKIWRCSPLTERAKSMPWC